jgi:hypothetical protein|tara:strand:- start:1460 stop:1675 length:216 start_codon:yes stop_codon:yes gene_type:complete
MNSKGNIEKGRKQMRKLKLETTDADYQKLAEAAEGRGKTVRVSRRLIGKITRDHGRLCGKLQGEVEWNLEE